MNAASIERELLAIIDLFTDQLPAQQLQDMRDLVNAGERGVALENLCTQVHEYDISVTPDVLTKIRSIGNAMRIASKYWEHLAVKGPH